MKKTLLLGVLVAPILLAACSSNDSYLGAKTLPPVEVPDGYDKETLGQLYRVPEGDGRIATGELKKPLPPSLVSGAQVSEPRFREVDGQSWLVVPKESSATWSQLLIYLQSRRISSAKQDVLNSTIETSWVIENAPPRSALRYRLHLESGLQPGLTEIHALNLLGQATDSLYNPVQWPQAPENSGHQRWFLKQLAKALQQQKTVGDSLIASSIELPEKVVSTTLAGEPVIELNISANRAYYAFDNALTNSDFVVFDKKPGQSTFYFAEDNSQKETRSSFFSRALSFGGSNDTPTSKYTIDELLARASNSGVVDTVLPASTLPDDSKNSSKRLPKNVPGYLLIIKTIGDKQRVHVRRANGVALDSNSTRLLLDSVKQRLF